MSFSGIVKKEITKRVEDLTRSFYESALPPVDIYEEGGYLIVVADLAGFNKANIHARITPQNELVIEADREISETGTKYLTQRPKSIRRVISLPVAVKKDGEITGKYENGVLTLRFPVEGSATVKIE